MDKIKLLWKRLADKLDESAERFFGMEDQERRHPYETELENLTVALLMAKNGKVVMSVEVAERLRLILERGW